MAFFRFGHVEQAGCVTGAFHTYMKNTTKDKTTMPRITITTLLDLRRQASYTSAV
jgi:hypothetical protein